MSSDLLSKVGEMVESVKEKAQEVGQSIADEAKDVAQGAQREMVKAKRAVT